MRRIGVLALQGAFAEHISVFRRLALEAFPVRLPAELDGIDGLVLPGGESTTMARLMKAYGLIGPIRMAVENGLPVLGTCAGLVMMAKTIEGMEQESLAVMDIAVRRNAFGRQVDSFEADLGMPALGELPFHAVFIRAPWIEKVGGNVEVLAGLADGTVVAARERNMVAAAFHPELTTDLRLHSYFLNIVDGNS